MKHEDRGQALVEFMLMLPILFFLFLGLAEIGLALHSYLLAMADAREAARYAAVDGYDYREGLFGSEGRVYPMVAYRHTMTETTTAFMVTYVAIGEIDGQAKLADQLSLCYWRCDEAGFSDIDPAPFVAGHQAVLDTAWGTAAWPEIEKTVVWVRVDVARFHKPIGFYAPATEALGITRDDELILKAFSTFKVGYVRRFSE